MLCRVQDSQLVVVDIQERLLAAMPEKPRQQLLKNTAILIDAAQRLDVPIHQTEQYPQGLGATTGDLTAKLQAVPVAEKTCFSCCGAKGFESRLGDAGKQIILTGIETHVCVLQTAIDLRSRGFQVFVVEDATCSRNKHHHRNALARMSQTGIVITNSESLIFEWLRDARHEHFKAVSKLLR